MSSIFVITEQRFLSLDNKIYSIGGGDESFWKRYLDVFDELTIIARIQKVHGNQKSAVEISHPKIKFLAVPYYTGIIQFLKKLPSIIKLAKKESSQHRIFILRCPGSISSIFHLFLQFKNIPYCMEVVGDPYDSLSEEAIGYFFAFEPIRILSTILLKIQCKNAYAISYVTKTALQERYPSCAAIKSNYSSIELKNSLVEKNINLKNNSNSLSLIFVGSLEQKYKGLHILLDAIQVLTYKEKILVNLKIIGDGKFRKEYEYQVIKLNINNIVNFMGYIKSGEDVFSHLHSSDLFVMPSLVEGLPRAMIEAMACGLICIGSNTGGIPELLSENFMFTKNNSSSLVEKVLYIFQLSEKEKNKIRHENILTV